MAETASGSQAQPPAESLSVQNLLLICIDTVRADTFFQLGELTNDRLSAWQDRGLVFTRAVSPAPWTVPSVASVFTGLWPVQHGAGLIPGLKQIAIPRDPPSVLSPKVRTIAQEASDNGFDTNVISASQWTFDSENPVGLSRGFAEFHQYVPELSTLHHEFYKDMLAQWRKTISEQAPDQRVLNFVHFIDAHNWHQVIMPRLNATVASYTPEQLELYRKTAPQNACDDDVESMYCKRYTVYAHAVGVLRDAIADMLDTLEENGQLENTAVVLFSDHGEEFNDHAGEERNLFFPKQPPHLGHGISLYEELLRVPLIVWHPGLPGARIDTTVSLIDIAPSAAAWLGLDFAPAGSQGRVLHEQLGGPAETGDRIFYACCIADGEKQSSVRMGAMKAISYMASDRVNYYDLEKDPGENHPVAPSNELVLAFDGHFLEWELLGQGKESEFADFSEEQIERLKAIGYLQGVETAE